MSLFLGERTSSVAALEVEPLAIVDNLRYISFGLGPSENKSVLLCAYTLDEGQAVSGVLWEILKEEVAAGTFEWKPNAPATATGLLKDKVNLERDDSDLELTALTYDLSANYSCTVTADDGTTASAKDEILIIDTTSNHIYEEFSPTEANCSIRVSVRYFPVFPAPTVAAGLYSESLGEYVKEVDPWIAIRHPNGSVGYSFQDYDIKVDAGATDDTNFRCELGVRKANGTVIGLSKMTSHFYFKHSCKVLPVGENQTVSYNTDGRTCYGEPYAPGTTEARVACAEGFVSSGNVTSVTLVCESVNATVHRWIPGDEGLLPEDLLCEPTPADGAAMRVASCYALLTATLLLCLHGR
ncbi:hypothetical protein C7M84_006296 [Penaeus vannamei]|uniref:Ig-like domain-containing protein n=1 Tax=Penaeus vannamei TaxID=6689 RepID=A0A423TFF7_PENVA|nr:uncharacterized protein LOC113807353 [Penaeus vannamei]ROT75176.1 hypothetical protein C7M84_006296 [Penaeus vannamei]